MLVSPDPPEIIVEGWERARLELACGQSVSAAVAMPTMVENPVTLINWERRWA